MTTVFPTPAPPNNPILPPFTNGAIRSMTLIPVSNTCVDGRHAPHHAVGRAHRHGADLVAADVLLYLDHHAAPLELDDQRVVEFGQVLRLELDVEHGADDLDHLADVLAALGRRLLGSFLCLRRHASPLSFESLS